MLMMTPVKKTLVEGANQVSAWSPTLGILCTQVRGCMSVEMANFIVEASQSVVDGARFATGFHHWWEQSGYNAGVRQVLVKHVLSIRSSVRGAHVLAQSRLVVIGINLSNAALGGLLKAYSDPKAFEAEFERTARTLSTFHKISE